MTSLKILLLTGTIALCFHVPARAETSTSKDIVQHEPAKALGGTVQPSITVFKNSEDHISDKSAALDLQVSGKPRLSTTANPDVWESELLDEQRRTEPGFFTFTAD